MADNVYGEKSWWQDWGDTVDVFDLRPLPPTPTPTPSITSSPDDVLAVEPKIYDFIIFPSSVTDVYYVRV